MTSFFQESKKGKNNRFPTKNVFTHLSQTPDPVVSVDLPPVSRGPVGGLAAADEDGGGGEDAEGAAGDPAVGVNAIHSHRHLRKERQKGTSLKDS